MQQSGSKATLTTLMEIDNILRDLLTEDGVRLWWTTPVPHFDKKTPNALVTEGRALELLEYVKTYRDPAFG